MDKDKDKVIPIDTHEDFVGRVKELTFADITTDTLGTGLWDSEFKAFIEAKTLKGLFFHEDWVFLSVDLIADHVSMSPIKVFNKSMEGGKLSFIENPTHRLNRLYERPNEFESGREFMYRYTVEDTLMGNALVWRPRILDIMRVFPADDVTLDFNDAGQHLGYIVRAPGAGFLGEEHRDGMFFPKEVVWHKRRTNPSTVLWGLSPFIPNRKSLLFNRYSQDYLNAFYLKGATPGMALKMEKNVSEESALRFLRSFESAHTGRRNNRRTLILPRGVDAKVITPTLGDQKLVDVINMNWEKILAILRIQKHMFSLAKQGSLGSEEAKEAIRIFYGSGVIPVQNKISEHLTHEHRQRGELEDDKVLMFDNSAVPALQDNLLKKAELGIKLRGQWTVNEIRNELWSKPPVDGGDSLTAVLPNDQGNNPVAGQGDAETGDVGEEPPPEEDKALPVEEWEDPEERAKIDARTKLLRDKFGSWIDKTDKQMDDEVRDKGKVVVDIWLDIFAAMAEKTIPIVKDALNKVPFRTKADSDRPSKIPSKRKLRRDLIRAFEELENQWTDRAGELLESSVELGFDNLLGIIINQEDRTAIQALRVAGQEGRRAILGARNLDVFKSVAHRSPNRILDVMSDGVKAGKNISAITADIVRHFRDVSPANAQRIANTEVLTAISIGEKAALDNAATVIPELVKVWIHTDNNRVRGPSTPNGLYPNAKDDHWVLQDQGAIPAKDANGRDTTFDNGLTHPRDLKSDDPAKVINCRCRLAISTPQDIQALRLPS